MKKFGSKVLQRLRKKSNLTLAIFFVGIIFVLLTNAFHESYPDEFDNILGGWYTLHGKVIYKDWFTHHNPMAYWLSSFIELFSGQSFVRFRVMYALLLSAYFGGVFFYFRKQFEERVSLVVISFFSVIAVASTYFWGQMLLADNLSALLFAPVFMLLAFKTLYKIPLVKSDFIFISIATFVGIFSSLTYAFLLVIIYLYTAYMYIKESDFTVTKKVFTPIIIFAIPYILLGIYFIVTGSLGDYIYQAVVFNGKYYVYNYPGHQEGVGFVNPVRYALVIFYNFFTTYTVLLNQAFTFNFSFPLNITLALANLIAIIYFVLRRKFALALFLFFYMVYANVRSNPLDSKETDYQSAVYLVVSLFNVVFMLYELYSFLTRKVFDVIKIIVAACFLMLAVYSFFSATFLLRSYGQKMYDKFMGFAPLIYDRPKLAPILNSVTTSDEYVWIGPFEFEELFYTNRPVPSSFHILIPGVGINNDTEKKMVEDFKNNPPVVMYYDRNFFILGRSPAMYAEKFNKFVDTEYVNIADLQVYEAKNVSDNYNLQTNLYIRKDKVDEIIPRLESSGYITVTQTGQ